MTETVTMKNSPAVRASSNSVRVMIANPAMAPPRANDPVSPMKIRAGWVFHHRNPKQAPVHAAANTVRSRGSRTW